MLDITEWRDRHQKSIDARLRELGIAGSEESRPGAGYYYGDIMPGEWYDENAVRDLGLMPDGSFRAPAVGLAAASLDDARHDLMAARDNRDHHGDRSLPALNAVCHANVAVHRAEQALAEAEQREAAGELCSGRDPRRRMADDELLLHTSLGLREPAEHEPDL
ncbi:hypothetical protein AD006_31555 (plasmid) [Pseudonocardia sp. EC080610-09]|uniref:hypothetical protein n=1 Tax=unclassified Pseudonocardia TaxID=2619320 RepID=UPI0007067451|nr:MULTISPECIES: hypothetical protein [unclassified Pseudonocardia]ALL79694.1 hypothetical protein AD006_31555 [Pseudonocardia sp. EC080610-09]ALL85352.1 hypothetical protein AD017_29695 [Pseudonocardia sp. EC080619-01]